MNQAPPGPLTEAYVRESVAPLFGRVLSGFKGIYLANHSLGRPIDGTLESVSHAVSEWFENLDDCWQSRSWLGEVERFRSGITALVGLTRGDCVVPKTSAGQGLRAVLNALPLDRKIRVVTTTGEFDSIDFILKTYESKGRADVTWISPTSSEGPVPLFEASALSEAITSGVDLVVVSNVFFTTGQVLDGLESVVSAAHRAGAFMLVDAYHAVGVVPFDMMQLDADFVIGGCYKYLRGGPGACYLAVHPRIADGDRLRSLDTGWFAKKDTFSYQRPAVPEFSNGGDAWLESTPPVLTSYQANPGIGFTTQMGVDRLRAYGLDRLNVLREAFERQGIEMFSPRRPESYGAFGLLPHADSSRFADGLKELGVTVDARGGFVRFGPDLLTTSAELAEASRFVVRALQE